MRFDIPSRALGAVLVVSLLAFLSACNASGDQDRGADDVTYTETQPVVTYEGGNSSTGMSTAPSWNTGASTNTGYVANTNAPAGGMVVGTETPSMSSPQEVPSLEQAEANARVRKQRQEELAKSYMQMGDRLLAQGRTREALEAYGMAVTAMPTNSEAQGKYSRLAAAIGALPDSAGSSMDGWDNTMSRMQQASTMANNLFDTGRTLITQGEYEQGIAKLRNAQAILEANPAIMANFDRAGIKAAIADAERMKERAELDSAARRRQEIEQINRDKDEEERQKIERRVDEMWEKAVYLFERERFEECEKLCGDLMDLAPNHNMATRLKQASVVARHQKRQADNIRGYREQWDRVLREVKDLGLGPEPDLISFPGKREWEKIASRGPIGLSPEAEALSESDQEVVRRLQGTQLAGVDWTDKTLDEAIRFLRNNTDTNIVIMHRVVDEVKPVDDRILNLTLGPISAMAALRHAVNFLELAMVIEDGMVKITTNEAARANKVVDYYEVRDLTADLNSFPAIETNLNPSGYGTDGDFGADLEVPEPTRAIESDRLMEMIRLNVDPVSWDEDPDNTIDYKNGIMVVRQTPKNHRKIRDLLRDLRKSTGLQVQIEARFISVENNFLQDVGVDLRGLGDQSGGVGVPGLGSASPIDDFGALNASNPLGTDNTSGVFYPFGGGNGDVRGRTQNLFDIGLGNPDVLTNAGGFSLQWSYLDDTQVEAILRATQKYERVNTVTAPTLMVSNTQRASLQHTQQIAYVKDFDVELAQAAVIADPIVDIIREGVILDVRPIVGHDRRFITLELRPSVSTLVRPIRTFTTTLGTGSNVTFETPEMKKESLKTTVVMPDGGTLLLGGLKFYEEQTLESSVPILGDIPIIEFFFSHKGKYTNMRDLIILLRAKVIIMSEYEHAQTR